MKLYDPTHARQLRDVRRVDTRDGITRLALAMDTVTPSVCWYTVSALKKSNTALAIAEILSAGEWQEANREIQDNSAAVDWSGAEDRYGYTLRLYDEIAAAIAEPSFQVYPRDVFLAAANYYLHTETMRSQNHDIDEATIAKSAKMIARAVASGQLPKVA